MKSTQISFKSFVIVLNVLFTIFWCIDTYAQVGINTLTPNSSSMLDINATDKGLLIPRMTSAQRLAITSPATGLMVYETSTSQFFYFDGAIWRPLASNGSDWNITGNTGTVAGTNFIGTTDSKDFVVKTTNIERMRFLAGGNSGIGTATPSAKLSVARVGGIDDVMTLSDDLNSVVIGTDFDLQGFMRLRTTVGTGFAITNNGDAVGLFVKSDATANVGVGTSSPLNKLHILKGAAGISPDVNASVALENNGINYLNILSPSTNENGILFGLGGGFTPSANNGGIIYNSTSTKKGFQFRTDGNVTKMILDSVGRIGLGLNPLYRMDIFTSGTADTLIYRGRNAAADGTMTQIGSVETFHDYANTIDFAGGSSLTVNWGGPASNSSNNSPLPMFIVNGNAQKPGGGSWQAISDERLKKDVNPFKDGLETLGQINPVYFKYNGKCHLDSNNYYVGVIAQDLQKTAPYMVASWDYAPNPKDIKNVETYLNVDNSALTYILVNSVKELNAKTENMINASKTIMDAGVEEITTGDALTVNFSSEFISSVPQGKIPVVTVTPVNSSVQLSITNVTPQGFTVRANQQVTGLSLNWIAAVKISKTQLAPAKNYSETEREQMIKTIQRPHQGFDNSVEETELKKRRESGEIK